jgi:hypothetical protein
MRIVVPIACLLMGCPPSEPPTSTIVKESVFEGESPWVYGYLEPDLVVIVAAFAYDAETDTVVTTTFGTTTLPPGLDVLFATNTWRGSLADDDNVCLISVRTETDRPRADWVTAEHLFGVDLGEALTLEDGCEGRLLEPADAGGLLASLDWSVAITPEVDADHRSRLASADIDPTAFLGGAFGGDVGAVSESGWLREVLTSASAVADGAVVVEDGNPVALAVDEMLVEGRLQSGFYSVQLTTVPALFDLL